MSKNKVPQKLVPWLEAKKRYRLSDDHIQMARELGMKPSSLAKLANTGSQSWKTPLPEFIADRYFRQFKRDKPEHAIVWRPIKKPKLDKLLGENPPAPDGP